MTGRAHCQRQVAFFIHLLDVDLKDWLPYISLKLNSFFSNPSDYPFELTKYELASKFKDMDLKRLIDFRILHI